MSQPSNPIPAASRDLAFEMAVWEVHRLRTELHVAALQIAIYAHGHPEASVLVELINNAKQQLDLDQIKALNNPELRKLMPADV